MNPPLSGGIHYRASAFPPPMLAMLRGAGEDHIPPPAPPRVSKFTSKHCRWKWWGLACHISLESSQPDLDGNLIILCPCNLGQCTARLF